MFAARRSAHKLTQFPLIPVSTRLNATFQARPFSATRFDMADIKTILTENAPAPLPFYSQAKAIPGLIFCSGQIPALAPNGELVQGSITEQTRAVCKNVKAVVEAAGSSMDKVVKVNCFISDMAHFAGMNEEYAKWFTSKPARTCVAVKTLPKNVDVEIECVAVH